MIKVRASIFETNSSSMDRYSDDENSSWRECLPSYTYTTQNVVLEVEWLGELSTQKKEEIIETVCESDEVPIIFTEYFENDSPEEADYKEDIGFIFAFEVQFSVDWSQYDGSYELTDCNGGVPLKGESFVAKGALIEEANKALQQLGVGTSVKVINIYGQDYNWEKADENIQKDL